MKLFIIGNGFDLSHGYNTRYTDFKKYLEHSSYDIGSFRLIDFFDDDDDLWSDFENNLEFIDFKESTDFYVGELNPEWSDKDYNREISRRSALQDSFEEAPEKLYLALCTALSDFIVEETDDDKPILNKYQNIMSKNDLYITFNYSKTLEKLYHIPKSNVEHIHGEAFHSISPDPDEFDYSYETPSIIFGHSDTKKIKRQAEDSNPINPNGCLNNINDQMKKVYQIQSLNSFIQGLSFSSVEIIGHDFGIVDKPYFVELNKYLNRTAIINYWLYNMSLKNIKYKELQAVFPQNKINIIPNK